MPSTVQIRPTERSASIDLSEYFAFIARFPKVNGHYNAKEAEKQWKELQACKRMVRRSGPVHIHGISNESRQSSQLSKKRAWDAENADPDDLAACCEALDSLSGHFNQKVAHVGSEPRSIESGPSRPCHSFVGCIFLFSVNADASRPCEDIIAAIEMLHQDMLKLYNAGTCRVDILLYTQVLELCQKLLNVVNQDFATSDPASSRQSRPHSESVQKQDSETSDTITKEDVDQWATNCEAATHLAKQFAASVKATAAQVSYTRKLQHCQDTANKRQKPEQKDEHAAATAAWQGSLVTIFDLSPLSGSLFQTVTEDAFLAMSAVEQKQMSMRPLLIRGCFKLKEQLANIRQLDDQMQSLALRLSSCLQATPFSCRRGHAQNSNHTGADTHTHNTHRHPMIHTDLVSITKTQTHTHTHLQPANLQGCNMGQRSCCKTCQRSCWLCLLHIHLVRDT
jgi:hypothetical protein